jgi:hypothetical protein
MNLVSLTRALAAPLALAAFAVAAAAPAVAQTASTKKPPAKATGKSTGKAPAKAPAKKAAAAEPLPPAGAEQRAAADLVHYGDYACEFKQSVSVAAAAKEPAYVEVKFGKQAWTMKPILSTTGALRLEDVKGEALMLQIAFKSMLMDVKAGRRLVDECVHEKQLLAKEAAAGKPQQAGIGIDPDKAAAEAQAAAAAATLAASAAAEAASAAATAASAAAQAASAMATPPASPASAPR